MPYTVGEIDNKLNTTIFSEKSMYQEREEILKKYINITVQSCIQLARMPQEKGIISYYKDFRVKRSMKKLCDYMNYLATELDENRIKDFFAKQKQKHPLFIDHNYDINLSFIFSNSYFGNIEHDLYWISEITVQEALLLSTGKFKIEKLSSKLPNSFQKFKTVVLPFFKQDLHFKKFYPILLEIENCYKNKAFKACNLLILTAIEGLVRDLGLFLIDKQQLEVKNFYSFNSLDSFLRKINWKKDYIISKTRYSLLVGDMDFVTERDSLRDINISLMQRLDFLRRRFKEDRDMILHGLESDYGKEWHLFVNFSALYNVYETCLYYKKLYK